MTEETVRMLLTALLHPDKYCKRVYLVFSENVCIQDSNMTT